MTAGIERDVLPPASFRIGPSDTLRLVRRGTAQLFAHYEIDGVVGPRRYIATIGPGDPVFGSPPVDGAVCTFVLAPVEPLRMLEYAGDGVSALMDLADAAAVVERWHVVLAPFLDQKPSGDHRPPPADRLSGIRRGLVERLSALEREDHALGDRQRRQRTHASRAITDQVFDRMASIVLGAPHAVTGDGGSPLAVAMRAVGAAQGLRITTTAGAGRDTSIDDELNEICRASRVRTRRVVLVEDWWRHDQGPLLAFTLDGRHPVALLPSGPAGYHAVDPGGGPPQRVDVRLAGTLAPVALFMYRQLPAGTVSPFGLMQFVLADRRRDLAMALLCALAATGLNMLLPAATGLIVDSAIPDADRALLAQLALGLLAAALGRAMFGLAQASALTRIQVGTISQAQPAVWDRVLNLPLRSLRQYSVGDLQARVGAITTMSDSMSGVTIRVIFAGVLSLLNFAAMPIFSPALTLVALLIAVPVVGVTIAAGGATLGVSRRLQALAGQTFGLSVQLINAVSKLQVAGAQSRAFAQWGQQYAAQQALAREVRTIQDRVTTVNQVLPTLAMGVLFAVAGTLLQSPGAALSTGRFLAFTALFSTFLAAATALSNTVIEFLEVGALWRRAKPLLDAEPEVDAAKANPGRLRGAVELERVRFRYRPTGPLTLSDVSIRAEPGQFIALVGPSGGGKSTIFRLILGFDAPESGAVFLDRQDLAGLDVHAVRRQFGVVLQNGRPIAGTIFENVAGGSPITLGQAWEALGKAGLDEDIAAWPMGIHTYVSEGGGNLSGGQRQRLLIARALVHAPPVLLFDEATSALDNQTQATVGAALERLGVTRVVIAHRLSTVRRADRIYVIDGGRVVQEGAFAQLAAEPGLFQVLMVRQTR